MTNNIDRRLKEHNAGVNPFSFTYKRRPIALLFQQEFNDIFQAYHFEARIKKWSSKKKRALANDDFDLIKILAECRNQTHSKFFSKLN
ncbi:GIY-YIG nuclease family protein [Nonlabens ponticola]|nr:GIY-YIG nuclease family protein [Nonlabens ponticola]